MSSSPLTLCRPQATCLFLQVPKIIRSGDLGDLTRSLGIVHLDAQLVDLALEPLLACADFARHALEYACQLPQRVGARRNLVERVRLEARGLHRRRGAGESTDLLQIFELQVAQAFPGQRTRNPRAEDRRVE